MYLGLLVSSCDYCSFLSFLIISKGLLSEKQDLAVDITDIIAVIHCENFNIKCIKEKPRVLCTLLKGTDVQLGFRVTTRNSS